MRMRLRALLGRSHRLWRAATAAGTVGDSEEPDTGTLSQPLVSLLHRQFSPVLHESSIAGRKARILAPCMRKSGA